MHAQPLVQMKAAPQCLDQLLRRRGFAAPIRADENDLAFITISVADNAGIIDVLDNTAVTVTVSGNGVLQGHGSADPKSEDDYASSVCTTFLGQALAVIRPTGPGEIKVSIESEKFATVETVIKAI